MYNKTLDTFKAVADCGSFSKASERLFITHTAVIKQISGLESRLGVKLFIRSSRGVAMTPAGQCLYGELPKVFQESDRLVRQVREANHAGQQTIRIGTSMLYPCTAFMDLWDTVSESCPGYQLKIVPLEQDENRFAGLDKSYDCLIGPYNYGLDSGLLRFFPTGQYRFHIAMPRKYRLSKQGSLKLADLNGELLMIMEKGNSPVNDEIRRTILETCGEIRLTDTPPHYNIKTFNSCAEKGCLLLSLECWKDIHPSLVSVPLEEPFFLPYGIVASAKPSETVRGFLEEMRNILLTVHGAGKIG